MGYNTYDRYGVMVYYAVLIDNQKTKDYLGLL